MTNMVIEDAFITKYKQAMFNNSPQEDIYVKHVNIILSIWKYMYVIAVVVL